MAHKYLSVFDHPRKAIVEVKRLDALEGTPDSEIHFWLDVDKVKRKCEKIMSISVEKQQNGFSDHIRTFEHGVLQFSQQCGFFIAKDESYHNSYDVIETSEITEDFKDIVSDFFIKNYPERTKLSDVPFNKINIEHTVLISAIGSEGKIVDSELHNNGNYLELILWIDWNNGSTSRVVFPDECTKITLKNEPYTYGGVK